MQLLSPDRFRVAIVRRPVQSGRPAEAHRTRGERGAALVEFALVLPVFAMLIFGAFSGAMAYNAKQSIVYAAREGARYGATIPQSQCTPTSNCSGKTWAQLVQAVVVSRSNGAVTTGDVCVALVTGSPVTVASAPFTTKSDGSACYSDSSGDTSARVQVAITHGTSINAVLVSIPVTESSQATARYEQ